MFELFFFPFRLMMQFALLPFRMMREVFRSGWFLSMWLVMGLFSLLAGLIRHALPLVLIGIGLTLVVNAYKAAKGKKEFSASSSVDEVPVKSFFTNGSAM